MADDISGLGSHNEIFTFEPDFSTRLDLALFAKSRPYSYPGTIHLIQDYAYYSPVILKFKYTSLSKFDEYNLIDFFNMQQGRFAAFWTPSYLSDFTLLETAPVGQDFIRVAPNNFFSVITGTNDERIYVLRPNGALTTRKIISAIDESNTVVKLNLDSALNIELNPDTIELIGRLYLVRFFEDKLKIRYDSSYVSSVIFRLFEVYREQD